MIHRSARLLGVAAAWGLATLAGPVQAQDYRFPTSVDDYPFWYVTAYKDQGGQDWNCGSIFYGGHGGTDFGGGSFTGMAEGRDVVAAADGVVDYTVDGFDDMCTTGNCPGGGGFGNYVRILHADGKHTYYGHLKTWSIPVSQGQAVSCGTKIGEMGSSGNSTGPHLHFEPRVNGSSSDPFDGPCSGPPTYWVDQGAYDGLPGLICDGTPACTAAATLTCSLPWSGSNDGPGSAAVIQSWGCVDFTYTGAETALAFVAPASGDVTFRATGLTGDLDLFVSSGTGCSAADCLAASSQPQTSDESVTVTVSAGQEYRVVIDGWEGATSGVTIEADCSSLAVGDDDDAGDDDAGDDDTSAGDDDTSAGDDDTSAGDDDTSAGDDDTGAGDDDTSAGDDDDAGDDDAGAGAGDEEAGPPDRGLGNGTRGCRADVGGGSGLLFVLVLGWRRRTRIRCP